MNEADTEGRVGLELTLDIWHPECWTLQVTADTDADLLGHGLHTANGTIRGLFTVEATSRVEIERVRRQISESGLTDGVWAMDGPGNAEPPAATTGTATQSVLVEWGTETGKNIVDSLVAEGFVPRRTYRMGSGREQWSVLTLMDRHTAQERLDDVSAETDADIRIQRISTGGRNPAGPYPVDVLTARQREVFEYACEHGYYDWPRTVSATDIAADLGITKGTVAEHLRKAESRLFSPFR